MPVAARLTVPVKLFDEVTVTTYVTVLPAVTVCCAGETLIENVPVPPVVLLNPVLQPFETARTTPMARNRTTEYNRISSPSFKISKLTCPYDSAFGVLLSGRTASFGLPEKGCPSFLVGDGTREDAESTWQVLQ